jgi:hypothetical protein
MPSVSGGKPQTRTHNTTKNVEVRKLPIKINSITTS